MSSHRRKKKANRRKNKQGRKNLDKKVSLNDPPQCIPQKKEKIKVDSLVISVKYVGEEPKKDLDDLELIKAKEIFQIGHDFTVVLQMLWQYISSIGVLAETTSNTSIATIFLLLDEIEEIEKRKSGKHIAEINVKLSGKDNEGNPKTEDKIIKIFDKSHLSKIIDFNNHNKTALTILHDTAIQQLVNAWEKLLSDMVSWFYKNNPDKITTNNSINHKVLLQVTDLDELKQTIIDSEIKSFISENNTKEQIKFFDDNFKTNFKSFFDNYDELLFLIYVRHLIVHYGGVVTKDFETKVSKLKNINHHLSINVGEKLNLTPQFIINSWENIYFAGVLLVHRFAKNQTPHQIEILDNFLNNSAFASIQKGQYTAALSILKYADKIHIGKTSISWSVKINLAQTYKWMGREDEFRFTINGIDIDAANARFQLCLAALEEDVELFKAKLAEVSKNNLVTVSELYEWPVFKKMRENSEFNKWVEDAYGYRLTKLQALLQPKILDLSPKTTINMIAEYYKEKEDAMKK